MDAASENYAKPDLLEVGESDVTGQRSKGGCQRIAVLGLGNFGTALASNWSAQGMPMSGWTVEQEVYDSISRSKINEKYLAGVALPSLQVSMDLAATVADADLIVLAVPSAFVLGVVDDLIPHLKPNQILLDVAKGLGPDDCLLSTAITDRLRKAKLNNSVAVMVGPTIAPELANGVHTTALVAGEDSTAVATLAERLSTPSLHLRVGSDPVGAELWGAFKNVIALMCGVADGVEGGGDNLKAALFAEGYSEGAALLQALGADAATGFSPAGIGDLFVTAISPHGRNRGLGQRLGSGMSLEEAMGASNMVAEGVRSARMFRSLAHNRGLSAPFVDRVNDLLDGNLNVTDCLDALLGPSAQPVERVS